VHSLSVILHRLFATADFAAALAVLLIVSLKKDGIPFFFSDAAFVARSVVVILSHISSCFFLVFSFFLVALSSGCSTLLLSFLPFLSI
jgi:hypothetical protein